MRTGALLIMLIWGSAALAEESTIVINPPEAGSITREAGLAAWDRIAEVATHPRCANCHVGPSDRPMWSGPSYGPPRPHGMNIRAGESRIGSEYVLCSTCHAYRDGSGNNMPHAAPQVAADWRLAPVEANWFAVAPDDICKQLRDPDQNGGRDALALAEHLDHDVILHWAWAPGGTREPAPYSLQEHVDDILAWGAAGMPCPSDS